MVDHRSMRALVLALTFALAAGCGSRSGDDDGLDGAEVRTCALGGADASCQICQNLGDAACCPLTSPAGCGTVADLSKFSQCSGAQAAQLCLVPAASGPSTLVMTNMTASATTVHMHFAAQGGSCPESNPPTRPEDVPFCQNIEKWAPATGGSCTFVLDASGGANASRTLPTISGRCLSGTFTFDAELSCASPSGVTGAEYSLNVAAPFQQTLNISLVNGWNHDIQMSAISPGGGSSTLGPTSGVNTTGLVGVYPNGCDVCQSRSDPPCTNLFPSLGPGTSNGCNPAGTPCQLNPVPAGSTVEVQLLR